MEDAKIDAIEIHPLVGLNIMGQTTDKYKDARHFDVCDEDDPHIIAWGVYVHQKGIGITNLFDVTNKKNAELAEKLLNKLYNL